MAVSTKTSPVNACNMTWSRNLLRFSLYIYIHMHMQHKRVSSSMVFGVLLFYTNSGSHLRKSSKSAEKYTATGRLPPLVPRKFLLLNLELIFCIWTGESGSRCLQNQCLLMSRWIRDLCVACTHGLSYYPRAAGYKRHANKPQSWSIPFELQSHSTRYDRPRNLRVHLCSWPFPLSISLFFILYLTSFIDWVKCMRIYVFLLEIVVLINYHSFAYERHQVYLSYFLIIKVELDGVYANNLFVLWGTINFNKFYLQLFFIRKLFFFICDFNEESDGWIKS